MNLGYYSYRESIRECSAFPLHLICVSTRFLEAVDSPSITSFGQRFFSVVRQVAESRVVKNVVRLSSCADNLLSSSKK